MTTTPPNTTDAKPSPQPSPPAIEAETPATWDLEPDPVIPVRWRPYLALAVFFVTLWLMFELSHELRYSWATGPAALGDISNGCDAAFYQKAQNNSFIRVENILPDLESTTEARVGLTKYRYAFAMGCDLLLAVPAERYQALFAQPGVDQGGLAHVRSTSNCNFDSTCFNWLFFLFAQVQTGKCQVNQFARTLTMCC